MNFIRIELWTIVFLIQGLPAVGSNAGAGTLDFLRNSQQVSYL